jgi:hypothetical protein
MKFLLAAAANLVLVAEVEPLAAKVELVQLECLAAQGAAQDHMDHQVVVAVAVVQLLLS